MENKVITGLLGSIENLTDSDLSKDANKFVMEIISNDPDKMAKFLTYNSTSSGFKTIMLCTGMNIDEIKRLPIRTVFKPLHEKSLELLEFMLRRSFRGLCHLVQFPDGFKG